MGIRKLCADNIRLRNFDPECKTRWNKKTIVPERYLALSRCPRITNHPIPCVRSACIDHCLYPPPHAMRERERNVLFNDALNTFYLRLYGVRHMVKDHSDSEKGNLLPPHRLLLSINSKGSFICTIPQTG